MRYIHLQCEWCGKKMQRLTVWFLRAGPHSYCGRECSGYARRKYRTPEAKQSAKADYDAIYRQKNADRIKHRKHEAFKAAYDPEKAKIERKKRMPYHVEYLRRRMQDPKYRQAKVEYDIKRRAKINYGAFADCDDILRKIEQSVALQMSDYEIRIQQGTLNKNLKRKRALHEQTRRS